MILQPQTLGKILLLVGVLCIGLGALFYFSPRLPLLLKWLQPLRWQKGPVTIYFPLGLCLLASALLTLLWHIGRRG